MGLTRSVACNSFLLPPPPPHAACTQRKVGELQRDLTKQIRLTKDSTLRLTTQLDKLRKESRGGTGGSSSLIGISEEHSDSGSSYGGSSAGGW